MTSNLGEEWERGYYHISNVQFSTESLISDACELIERVRYEAYGKARHGWPEDLDGNGSVTQADRDIGATCDAGATIGDTGYNVLVDLDFSGDLDSNEVARCEWSSNAAALDAGAISDPDFDEGPWNPVGFDGYVYDDVADLSCVRFRWYDAGLGRWMTRDPIGLLGGSTRVEYGRSSPRAFVDPLGLEPELWEFGGINNPKPYVLGGCRSHLGSGSLPNPTLGRSYSSELGRDSRYQKVVFRSPGIPPMLIHEIRKSRTTSCGHDSYISPTTSEQQLDTEATCIAGRERAGAFCCPDGSPPAKPKRILLIMIAPKTTTVPSAPCCDFKQIVYYSPFDNVPNQGVGNQGGPGDAAWWKNNFSEVRLVYTPENTNGELDPTIGWRWLTGDPYPNHSLQPYLPCSPSAELRAASGASMAYIWWQKTDTWVQGAAYALRQAVNDDAYDIVGVCHSQGCNIAMHVFNRLCSPDPNGNAPNSGRDK